MPNFKLTLCYDGGRYDGWQRQGNSENTIQGKLEALLTRLLEQSVEVAGSGRTDAGVHALGQVCSFRAETELGCAALLREMPLPAGGHRRDLFGGGRAALSRPPVMPGEDLCLSDLEQ